MKTLAIIVLAMALSGIGAVPAFPLSYEIDFDIGSGHGKHLIFVSIRL